MVWTVSQTAATLTITPDGTSSENLSTVLDLAISTLGVNAGVTKPSLYTYEATKKILVAADVSTNYLYVSGLNLTIRDQFIRASNSRVRFGNVNALGAVVGKANIIISNIPHNSYAYPNAPFTVGGSNAFSDATDLTLIFRKTAASDGSIVNGYDIAGLSVGSFTNCSFQADSNGDDSNALFFLSAETFTNCTFAGWSGCELSSPGSILKNCTFTTIGTLSSGVSGSYYLEQITSAGFKVLRSSIANLVDCNIASFNTNTTTSVGSIAGNEINLRNSLTLLGSVNEANGLFVARLLNNTQVYKRTFSASGLISGGNAIGATDGVTSSSERLLILLQRHAVSGSAQVIAFDYRGTWEGVFVKYGRLPTAFSFNLQGTTTTLQNIPFSTLPDTGITVSNPATVAAYTTIAINHSTSTVTISGATTQRQLHDYCALEKASFADSGLAVGGNPVPKACLPTIGSSIYNRPIGTFLYNLSLSSGATLTGLDSVTLAAGKNVTLAAIGTYTTSPIEVSSTSIVTVAPGNTDLRGWLFTTGATINVSSGSAIVTVAADQLANVIPGVGVTVRAPLPTLTVLGFQPLSNITISQGGQTLRQLNSTSPPFTWEAVGVSIPSNVNLTVVTSGFEIYTQTVSITSANQSVTVAQIPSGSTDAYNGSQIKFQILMISDLGFKRVLNAASGSLLDDAANCRLAAFENTSVKTSWNLLVGAIAPTSGEIAAWQGYLTLSGYTVVSFSSAGVVS